MQKNTWRLLAASTLFVLAGATAFVSGYASSSDIPIADVHVHYSHDSVELTPPARVIELA